MIPIREQFEVPAAPEAVWPLLSDPAFVVTCLPGAALVGDHGDGSYDGTLAVKFGPITATFRGVATIVFDHSGRSCTIEARGQDGKGASRATASASVTTSGDATRTVVSIDGGFQVSGPLGQFARTGGQHLAREMLSEFSTNLARRLQPADAAPTPGGTPATATPAARELSAFNLLWRAFLGWARHALGRAPG